MNGFVYFLQAGATGPVKIGFSATSVERRIHGNQVGCPQPLALLGVVAGNVALEKRFHAAFRSCALRGEWFKPHPRLLSFIRKVAVALPVPVGAMQKPSNMTALQEIVWAVDHTTRTRREFAKAVGIGDAYLSQILSGVRPLERLPFGLVIKICRAAGVPIERTVGTDTQLREAA